MHNSQKNPSRNELNKTVFLLATVRGLEGELTHYLSHLNSAEALVEFFYKNPRARKRFYRRVLFSSLQDPYRLNLAAGFMVTSMPNTLEGFRLLPVNKIKSNELKKFLIAGFFAQLYNIKTNYGRLPNEIAGRILQYVPINGLTYKLKNEENFATKPKNQQSIRSN